MRYTVTSELDPELFAELERERRAAGLSRSASIRQAVEWWVLQRKEHGEERIGRAEGRHRQLLRRIDYLVGMIREQEKQAAEGEEREDRKPELQGQDEAPRSPDGALAQARKRARRRTE